MGTFSGGFMLDPTTGRPVSAAPIAVTDFTTGAPVVPERGPLATGAFGGYGRFTVDGLDVVQLRAGGVEQILVSIERQLSAADSGTSGAEIKIGGAQPSSGWWLDTGTTPVDPDPEDTPVTATGPTWTDDAVNGGGTWTTPTETGITYSPASGTANPEQTVTVAATATTGYYLTGTTSWSHTFPAAPVAESEPDWTTLVAFDDFERADTTPTGGTLGAAATGGAWADPQAAYSIASGHAVNSAGTSGAIATVDAGNADIRVAAPIHYPTAATGQHGVVARCSADNATYYHARFNGNNSLQLYRSIAGSLTLLGSHALSPVLASGSTSVVTLRVWESGGATEVRVDLAGTEVITATDTTAGRPTGTRVGFRTSNNVARFDSITAHA